MSDEVSQFLEQVERLRGQQVEEDEVRTRELEEYLAAKRERQARREERARSISPQKSSPANTPSPRSSSRRSVHLSDALRLDSPAVDDRDDPAMAFSNSSSPTKENEAPADAAAEVKMTSGSTPPARSSTLSWQRRPNSRGGSRPLSMVAAQNATQRSLAGSQEPASATEQTFSKDQIAQALGSKDPAWFRQTAERGQGSAAYRKNQVEDDDRLDMSSVKAQLPGMAADTPTERPASRTSTAAPVQARLASPLPLNPPRFDGSFDNKVLADQPSIPAVDRTSPNRSPSPTKGMGGFVQSAMMKRSDSVKRWSVTSPPGLTRGDSVASARTGGFERALPSPGSRPQSMIRGDSTTPTNSRPTSRGGDKDIGIDTTSAAEPTKPSPRKVDEDAALPSSPTKTMDPRRWSPTKSSWLEAALNKPESPKPQPKPASTQPAWMVELNKNKAGRTNPGAESNQVGASHKHQVSIGGLMRATPMGSGVKPNTPGLGGIYSPPPGGNRPAFGHRVQPSLSKSVSNPEASKPEESAEVKAEAEPEDKLEEVSEKSPTEEAEEVKPALKSPPIATREPPQPKAKPETPPKKDFRAGLKQRPIESGSGKSTEPEFKNVFGNLRRTQTKNYKAPDELKDNILRGKAGLAATGGPKKAERTDEFKDAILKKKDDFKKAQSEGKGVPRNVSSTAEKPVPEGLAKRAELGRSMTGAKRDSADTKTPVQPKKAESPKPSPGPKRIPSQPSSLAKSPAATPSSDSPSLEKLRRVTTEPQPARTEPKPRALPGLYKVTSEPSKPEQGRAGGKLADRFNPALANMLARGPPPAASGVEGSEEAGPRGKPAVKDTTEPSAPGPQLTHMTKGRARGPKRKAPTTAVAAPAAVTTSLTNAQVSRPEVKKPEPEKSEDQKPAVPATRGAPLTPAPLSVQQQVAAKAGLRGKVPPAKPEPISLPVSVDTLPSVLRRQTRSPDKPLADLPAPLRSQKTGDAASQPSSPRKLDVKRMSKFLDETPVVDAQPEPVKEPARLVHQRTGSRSPVKLPEQAPSSPTKVDSDPGATVKDATSMFGGATAKSPPIRPKPTFESPTSRAGTPPRARALGPRPLPVPSTPTHKSPRPVESPAPSPTKAASELSGVLKEFFGPQKPRPAYNVDAAEMLANRPRAGAKIRSSGAQMFQISGDGKKTPVATHHERVLFEREMYICAHEFAGETGRKTVEVYFWVGDEVGESTAEDAQLFAQREARSLGGRLVKLQQGKETAEFVQALGGVIITRRGSSNKYDSLAPNVLCGRRYLGQVAFDEVDFAPASLCAGFPYLITLSGKCYLWKGKGSDVDEVACARLIGMDLALMGELIEHEDGAEDAGFWEDVFGPGAKKPFSADHWRLKPSYSKYGSRLFCSDADSRQQIFEIHPFNQGSITSSSIYILDAFFEVYVIVGARAQPQYASFRNALDFAHEYAILAAGVEDRPFVPVSSVVLEGVPRDLKRVFRKWDEAHSPTVTKQALKRGRSLRVVPLTQALLALKE